MPPPAKSRKSQVMSERQQMQMIRQLGDSGKTTPGSGGPAESEESSTSRPIAQHAKKSIPADLKGKVSSDENDENLTSSVSGSKDEGSANLKETTKSEENQSSNSMNTKDDKTQSGTPSPQNTQQSSGSKRAFTEVENTEDAVSTNITDTDETKRKKRKDGNASSTSESLKDKEAKPTGTSNKSSGPHKSLKQNTNTSQGSGNKGNSGGSAPSSLDGKSPCPSPKVALGGSTDGEADDIKEVPKVPPLKIVIPSSNIDNDNNGHGSNTRNGKNSSARNASLPYVVTSSNSNDAIEKSDSTSRCNSPADSTKGSTDEKTSASTKSEEGTGRGQQRVLRSSNRNTERSSNNSSPQMQGNNSSSVSPAPKEEDSSKATENTNTKTTSPTNNSTEDSAANNATSTANVPSSESATTSTTVTTTPSNELHPRKRKIKQKQEDNTSKTAATVTSQANDTATSSSTTTTTTDHPHDHPFTNCYQMFMDIRKQIEQKHKNILPIQPKPPQGFNDYLMNRKTYLLASRAPPEDIQIPTDVASDMKDLFVSQERERVKLKLRHIVEKEKLGLCVEQEILRVHAKAARSLANQSVPYSACTMLKDEEIYNIITPEQEEKDRNARSRYNGRLFLSWLQDVDDKWEKIKEAMILRHHNEAESLHAVQRMDWEFALVEKGLHGFKIHPEVKNEHVPIVPVSDEFDLLPA